MKTNPAIPNQLSRRLRDLIKESGLNISEISRRAQVANYFIYDIIAGKNCNPSVVKISRIAEVLGIPLDGLMKNPKNEGSTVLYVKNKKLEAPVFVPPDIYIKLNKGNKLRPFDDVIQDVIISAVKFCNGNKTQAADGLRMSPGQTHQIPRKLLESS